MTTNPRTTTLLQEIAQRKASAWDRLENSLENDTLLDQNRASRTITGLSVLADDSARPAAEDTTHSLKDKVSNDENCYKSYNPLPRNANTQQEQITH